MFDKNPKKMAVGAILGTLLGSLSAILASNNQKYLTKGKEWVEKARDMGENVINEVRHFREPHEESTPAFMKGALIGLLLGAGTTLFLTPRTGKQLRNDLSKKYEEIFSKAQEVIEALNHNETLNALKKSAGLSGSSRKSSTHNKQTKSTVKRAVAKTKSKKS